MTKMAASPASKRAGRIIRAVVSIAIVGAAGVFCYHELAETGWVPSIGEITSKPMAVEVEEHPWREVDWANLQAANPEVVGWIEIPGTSVSQPVCQAPADDPEKYLHTNAAGEADKVGAAFVDAECTEGIMGTENTAILGHHWHDGSMFSDIAEYSNEGWAKEHTVAYLQTPKRVWTLELTGAEIIRGTELAKRCVFEDEDDFHDWYLGRLGGAEVVLDERAPSQIVSLVTCSYNYTPKNERTIAYFAVASSEPQR